MVRDDTTRRADPWSSPGKFLARQQHPLSLLRSWPRTIVIDQKLGTGRSTALGIVSSWPTTFHTLLILGRGVTAGCGKTSGRNYCPGQPVRRDQVASFLVRAIETTR